MHLRQVKGHVFQSVSKRLGFAGENAITDRTAEVGVGKLQAITVNPMKVCLAVVSLALDVKHRSFVPPGSRQPAGVEDPLEFVFAQCDHLDAHRKYTANCADVFALHLEIGTRLLRIGERGMPRARTRCSRKDRHAKQANLEVTHCIRPSMGGHTVRDTLS